MDRDKEEIVMEDKYIKLWNKLRRELVNMRYREAKTVDPSVVIAYMDSLERGEPTRLKEVSNCIDELRGEHRSYGSA